MPKEVYFHRPSGQYFLALGFHVCAGILIPMRVHQMQGGVADAGLHQQEPTLQRICLGLLWDVCLEKNCFWLFGVSNSIALAGNRGAGETQ